MGAVHRRSDGRVGTCSVRENRFSIYFLFGKLREFIFIDSGNVWNY